MKIRSKSSEKSAMLKSLRPTIEAKESLKKSKLGSIMKFRELKMRWREPKSTKL